MMMMMMLMRVMAISVGVVWSMLNMRKHLLAASVALRQGFTQAEEHRVGVRNTVCSVGAFLASLAIQRCGGQPIPRRARAHATLVVWIFVVKSLPKALAMLSGGPPSIMSLSGIVRHNRHGQLRGRDKLT